MVRYIFLFFVFLILLIPALINGQERFSIAHDWNNNFEGISSVIIEDNGYLGTNLSWEMGADTDSIVMLKTDFNGNIAFEKLLLLKEDVEIRKTANLYKLKNQEGYLIGASVYINNQTNWTSFIIRLDNNLDTIWTKKYLKENQFSTSTTDFHENEAGHIVTAGYTSLGESEGVGANFLILDPVDGSIIVEKKVGDHNLCNPFNIAPTPDGGYLISGFADRDNPATNAGISREGYLLKITADGEKEWEKIFQNEVVEHGGFIFRDMKPTQDGNFIIITTYTSERGDDGWATDTDAVLLKINPQGEVIWEKYLGVVGDTYRTWLKTVDEAEDGTILLGGESRAEDGGQLKGLFYKLTPLGEVIWERYYRHEERIGSHYISKVLAKADGGLIACGSSSSPQDGWLLKLDCNGCLDETCPLDGEECIPYDCAEDTPPLASFSLPEPPYNTTDEEPFTLTLTNESENAAAYEWFLDGVFIGDSIQPTLSLPGGQSYTLELIAYNQNCQDSYVATFYVDNTLSLNQNHAKVNPPKLYPNPATDVVTVEYDFEQQVSIKVIGVMGKELYHETVSGSSQHTLTTSNWNKGIYYVMIKDGATTYPLKLIVK